MNLNDITGNRFGRLTVVKREGHSGGNVTWLCNCDCGNQKVIRGSHLKSGRSKSCGCLRNELAGDRARIHGKTFTPEFAIWRSMINRCTNVNDISYKNYGGRGISVCNRWRVSFENFLSDMGERPDSKSQIDRIDNNGNYEPSNCRWANLPTQRYNRRKPANNTTGLKGVYRTKGKFQAKLQFNNKMHNLGTYPNYFDACCARKSAELRLIPCV